MILGSQISGLLLAEKNVVDFVDKNLGQERDRLKKDDLERIYLCHHLIGGILDYPVMVSHDFSDITTAWDVYVLALTREMNVQNSKKVGFGIMTKEKEKGNANDEKNDKMSKMPFRGDELNQKQFVNSVIACCPKIRKHIIECTEEVVRDGRLENLFVIISNTVIIRNYIWVFLEIFDPESESKLKNEYKVICELVEVVSEQMLQSQTNLLTAYVLHDENSQNWQSNHAYFEGERGSPTIQMWNYFLESMIRDMWNVMPPQLSQRVLAILLNDSLAIITARYAKLKVSQVNIPQYVSDIINVLATVEKLLFCISTDLETYCGQAEPSTAKIIFSIQTKCHCLAATLILIGCPLEIVYKSLKRGILSCSLLDYSKKELKSLTKTPWMEVLKTICPKYYPSNLSQNDWELLMHLKLTCSQPFALWPLVYRVITMNDCKIASIILNLFPTVVAPPSIFLLEGQIFKRCGYSSCTSQECHSLPKTMANYTVAACTIYIVANGLPREALPKIYRPILSNLRLEDWSVMDKTQVWNSKARPVWFQSLIDILLPILKTCVQSLCLEILKDTCKEKLNTTNTGKSANPEDSLSTQFVIELLNMTTDIISIIPRGFFMITEEMDDLIPVQYTPVRNNAPLHFLVTALYTLLNVGPGIVACFPLGEEEEESLCRKEAEEEEEGSITNGEDEKSSKKRDKAKEKLEPILLSISERLCHLGDNIFDQVVHRLNSQIESMMKQTEVNATKIKHLDLDYAMESDIANLKTDLLLDEIEGQLSLRVVYWFLKTHENLLENLIAGDVNTFTLSKADQKSNAYAAATNSNKMHQSKSEDSILVNKAKEFSALGSTSLSSKMPNMHLMKIAPRIKTSLKLPNSVHDFHYVNKYRTFDEIIWTQQDLDWVKTIRCKLGLQKNFISKQLERRWEFQNTNADNTSDPSSSSISIKSNRKIVEEIRALVGT